MKKTVLRTLSLSVLMGLGAFAFAASATPGTLYNETIYNNKSNIACNGKCFNQYPSSLFIDANNNVWVSYAGVITELPAPNYVPVVVGKAHTTLNKSLFAQSPNNSMWTLQSDLDHVGWVNLHQYIGQSGGQAVQIVYNVTAYPWNGLVGLTADDQGNIWIATPVQYSGGGYTGKLVVYQPSTSVVTTLNTLPITSVLADPNHNVVWATSIGSSSSNLMTISMVPPYAQSSPVPLPNFNNMVVGMALLGDDQLWISGTSLSGTSLIRNNTTGITYPVSQLTTPIYMAYSSGLGLIFVSAAQGVLQGYYSNPISWVPPLDNTRKPISFTAPQGIAVDGYGNIWVADVNQVVELTPISS